MMKQNSPFPYGDSNSDNDAIRGLDAGGRGGRRWAWAVEDGFLFGTRDVAIGRGHVVSPSRDPPLRGDR